jgi:hypothetical protein
MALRLRTIQKRLGRLEASGKARANRPECSQVWKQMLARLAAGDASPDIKGIPIEAYRAFIGGDRP